MDLPQALTEHAAIPFISSVVAKIAVNHPEVGLVWAGISGTYLVLKAIDPRADEFIKKVKNQAGEISEELVKSTEFQQSILVTLDALIRNRNEKKRRIIENIYLYGYMPSKDKKKFELEKFYQVSQNISIEAVSFLRYIRDKVLPLKQKKIREKLKGSKYKEGYTEEYWHEVLMRNDPESLYIRALATGTTNHIATRFIESHSTNSDGSRNKEFTENIKPEQRRKFMKLEENAAELLTLGVFRISPAYDETEYVLTDFGQSYLTYLDSK